MNNWILRLVLITFGLGLLAACTAAPTPTLVPTQAPPTAVPQPTLIPTQVPPTITSQPTPVPAQAPLTPQVEGKSVAGMYPSGQYGLQLQIAAAGTAVLHTLATRILKAADWNGLWALQDNGAVITITSKADGTALTNFPTIKVGVVSGTRQITAFGVNGEFYDRSE